MRRVLLWMVAAMALAGFTAVTPALGATSAPSFSPPMRLPKWSGSEPSITVDANDRNAVYVSAPQHIPAALNPVAGNTGSGTNGVGIWASHDAGETFPVNSNIGSTKRGGGPRAEG